MRVLQAPQQCQVRQREPGLVGEDSKLPDLFDLLAARFAFEGILQPLVAGLSAGMPLLYLPVSSPEASGDQIVVPSPNSR